MNDETEHVAATIRDAANNDELRRLRASLARFAAEVFIAAGSELHVVGHVFGSDRVDGTSPFGHGTDETVAVSLLLRIANQLVSAGAELFTDGRAYAAAALLRQLVEVEYLAWAMETRDSDAQRWLRSSREERESFFTPGKLLKAAGSKFRGKDYGHHCEMGGHPVPRASVLLDGDPAIAQLFLADLLGHSGRIWDHFIGWAVKNPNSGPLLNRHKEMANRFAAWKSSDPLASLPLPP